MPSPSLLPSQSQSSSLLAPSRHPQQSESQQQQNQQQQHLTTQHSAPAPPPPPPLPPPPSPPSFSPSVPSLLTYAASAAASNITPSQKSAKLLSSNILSTSLDHDIFVRRNRKATEWKQRQQYSLDATPHAASTSSLSSSGLTAIDNYQEFKMEIINQGKCLCGQYIRARLRRAGVLNRKVIQRLRSILEPSSEVVYDVFPALNSMGEELERMHPRVYTNVSRQLSRAPYGELDDSDTAPMLLDLVAKDLFRANITWGKIISIFAVCGGFAIDCVRQGHYDYLQFLVHSIGEIIEEYLVFWLIDNGGWKGLQQHIRPQVGQFSFLGLLTLFVTVSSGIYVISNFVKHIGCHLYSLLF